MSVKVGDMVFYTQSGAAKNDFKYEVLRVSGDDILITPSHFPDRANLPVKLSELELVPASEPSLSEEVLNIEQEVRRLKQEIKDLNTSQMKLAGLLGRLLTVLPMGLSTPDQSNEVRRMVNQIRDIKTDFDRM